MPYLVQYLLAMVGKYYDKGYGACKKLLPYPADIVGYMLLLMAPVAFVIFFFTESVVALFWSVGFLVPMIFLGDFANALNKKVQRRAEWKQWCVLALATVTFGGLSVAFSITVF